MSIKVFVFNNNATSALRHLAKRAQMEGMIKGFRSQQFFVKASLKAKLKREEAAKKRAKARRMQARNS